ncbi:MAG: hypothetical protein CVV55_07335, partial [Synergistetes bacterium HGW-Synergistetes-2]
MSNGEGAYPNARPSVRGNNAAPLFLVSIRRRWYSTNSGFTGAWLHTAAQADEIGRQNTTLNSIQAMRRQATVRFIVHTPFLDMRSYTPRILEQLSF